jgi:2-desacetyl-2-hydroxyethyl bacteriochlorophyllide A dehydrogenase
VESVNAQPSLPRPSGFETGNPVLVYDSPVPTELLLTAPYTLRLEPYDEAPLKAGEVRAQAILSALSHGTELSLYRGTAPFHERAFDPALRLFRPAEGVQSYPTRLGYEWIGRVTEVAPDVTGFAVGDTVHLPLPHRETHIFGAAEMEALGVEPLVGLEPERAALLQSTGIALQALHDARVKLGDVVVVFGLGALGLLAVQLASHAGAAVVVAVDPLSARRRLAEETGATFALDPTADDVGLRLREWNGADVAIEFSGSYAALHEAIRSVRVAGLVVAAGFYQGGGAALRLGEEWHHNRVTMVSSQRGWGNPHRDAPAWDRARLRRTALRLLGSGALDVSAFITHRFAYERAADAYALIDQHPAEVLKVVLEYA